MKLADLKNIIPLGVLADGVYPSGYNSKENKYENFKDDEEDIVYTSPIIYLYYRNNGHLYLYRSVDEIEIDLTNVTSYDYTALFKFTDKSSIEDMTIDDFQHITLDVDCYTFNNTWVKPSQSYLYILVPVVRSIHSIYIQNQLCSNLFKLDSVWQHNDKCYWVYRTDIKSDFDFNDEANAILEVKTYVKQISPDELNPLINLSEQFNSHLSNFNNPHNVTPLQLGLDKVDNVSDIDKPVSNPQREFVNETIVPFNQHVSDKNNPHNTTKAQIGLGNVDNVSDINKPISNPQKTFITEHTKSLFEHLLKRDNPHNVNKEQIGLSDVDNTADIDKPVSNPQKEFIKQYVKDQLKDIPSGGGGGGGIASSDHFKYYEFLSDYETAKANEEFVQPCIIYIEETNEVLYHMNKAQYMARFVWSAQFIEDMNTMGMPIIELFGGIPLVFKAFPITSCIVNGVERINDFETIIGPNGQSIEGLLLKEIPNEGEVFEINIVVGEVISDFGSEMAIFTHTPVEEIIINDDVVANFKPWGHYIANIFGADPSYDGFGFAMLFLLLYTTNLKTLRLDITDASVLGTDANYLDIDYGWMIIQHPMFNMPLCAQILTQLKNTLPKLIIPADNPTYGSDDDPLDNSVINITVIQRMLEQSGANLFTLQRE